MYEVFVEILKNVLMILGGVTVAFISYYIFQELKEKIKRVMRRQSKIRCLCKHEYVFEWVFYYGRDLKELSYKCRKCGKVLRINVVEDKELENE